MENENEYSAEKIIMNEQDFNKELYFNLRQEISDKTKRIEDMSTFCVTTTLGLITFVIEKEKDASLILLPLILILFVSFRAASNRADIAKISAYIQQMEEKCQFKWETNNSEFYESLKKNELDNESKIYSERNFYSLTTHHKYPDFLVLSIICVAIFILYKFVSVDSIVLYMIMGAFSLIFLIPEIYVSYHLNNMSVKRDLYKKTFDPKFQLNGNSPKKVGLFHRIIDFLNKKTDDNQNQSSS